MTSPAQNLKAALLVVAGITAFCLNDAVVKALTTQLPAGQIVALRGLFVIGVLIAVLPRLGMRLGRPDRFAIMRALAEIGVNTCFVASLYHLPLGDSYTLYFVAPLMLTAAAALFLGERVGPRRWAAVLVGFLGVVIAVGAPGSWRPAIMLPLMAAVFSVARDLATSRVGPEVGSGTVALATAAAVTAGGLLTLPLGWVVPEPGTVLACLAAAVGAGTGYVLFVMGMRAGDLSFVAPFRYAGIPAAMLLGLIVWGDVPSPSMLLGAIVIVGSGVFILHRERVLARQARAAS